MTLTPTGGDNIRGKSMDTHRDTVDIIDISTFSFLYPDKRSNHQEKQPHEIHLCRFMYILFMSKI